MLIISQTAIGKRDHLNVFGSDYSTCYAVPSKSREVLGWEATHDQNDMCRDSWHWQSLNPNGYDD